MPPASLKMLRAGCSPHSSAEMCTCKQSWLTVSKLQLMAHLANFLDS